MMKFPPGTTAELVKVFTESDVKHFAEMSLDFNPLHLDEEYASKTVFGRRIVHGSLVGELISAVLRNKAPRPWFNLSSTRYEV